MSKINFKISCHHQLSPEVCHQSHRRIFSLLLISIYRKIMFYRPSRAMSGFFVKSVYFIKTGYLLEMDIYSKVDHFTQKYLFRPRNPLFCSNMRFRTRKPFIRDSMHGSKYRKIRPGNPWIPDSTLKPYEAKPNLIPPINQILIFFISISGTFFLFKF